MTTLVIATRNRHKASEIRSRLGNGFRCLTLADFPAAPAVVEDAPTFAGNATKKAVALAAWLAKEGGADAGTDCWVLADDSGLEVDALGGAPGVHSARFAAAEPGRGDNTSDLLNNNKLLRLLVGVAPARRTARFRCVLALAPLPSSVAPRARGPRTGKAGGVEVFEGVCEGHLLTAPRGQAGFGYDPLFVPRGYELSFAELGKEVKNRISHRAQALSRLEARLAALPDRGSGATQQPAPTP